MSCSRSLRVSICDLTCFYGPQGKVTFYFCLFTGGVCLLGEIWLLVVGVCLKGEGGSAYQGVGACLMETPKL